MTNKLFQRSKTGDYDPFQPGPRPAGVVAHCDVELKDLAEGWAKSLPTQPKQTRAEAYMARLIDGGHTEHTAAVMLDVAQREYARQLRERNVGMTAQQAGQLAYNYFQQQV
jgi:hypothetical protein